MILVLSELLLLQLFASVIFEPFEIETPKFKKILKWLLLSFATICTYYLIGDWAVLFPFIPLIIGGLFHFNWCKQNGIDPFRATPRIKYYKLRGWKWPE